MKRKLMMLALIPVLGIVFLAVNQLSAASEPDYDVAYGDILSDTTIEPNSYVDIPNKPSDVQYDITIPDTFDLKAQDAELELYLEPETLAIAVRVKDNGYVYSSYNFNDDFAGKSAAVVNPIKSGITLDLYKETTPVSTAYLDERPIATGENVAAATSTVENLANGFILHVDFDHPEIMIRFDVTVTLDNGRLHMHVPHESIEEYNPNLFDSTEQFYLLRNIVLFPYFGSTVGEDDGYVMIPDGSGMLVSLDDDPLLKSSFSLNVYGQDYGYSNFIFRERSQSTKEFARITVPVYGMFHDVSNTGFYVTVEEGAFYSILNFKSAGVVNDYYKTHFSYRYRESYEQYQSRSNEDQFRISFLDDPNPYDVDVTYTFLSGTDADYVGMAKHYQSDLIAKQQLGAKERATFSQTPTKVDFIGSEITMGVLRPKSIAITTYQQVIDILQTFQNDGYNELVTSYKTYSMDQDGYRFEQYRSLGGNRDFEELLEFTEEQGIEFSYFLDYTRSFTDRVRQNAQTLSKRQILHIELSWMFFVHALTNTTKYDDYAESDIEKFEDAGIQAIAMAGLDRSLYTSWDDRPVLAMTHQERIETMMAMYDESDFQIGLYNPDSYLYPYVSRYYNAPISSSDFAIASASIPFVNLVVGGYVDMYSPYLNFASNETFTMLRLVEYGIYPSYILTGGSTYDLKQTNSSNVYISEYDVLQDRIAIYYNFINEGLTATIGKEMTDHSFVAEGVVLVTYDDGTQILINYNDEYAVYDTSVIPAEGYVVVS